MDAKSVGSVIAELRKKNGITQLALAQKLNISDKTVSKWEIGQGFPEIIQFPKIAEIFGVSVDYLMTGRRNGIALAGNILTDIVKNINNYPDLGMLANINKISRSVGGCVPNTGINLAKIDRNIPLKAIGKVGDDENGRFVVSQLQQYGIDTRDISLSTSAPTSFSDVMSMPSGERTFFHAKGANAEFAPDNIDLASLNCKMLHIGYILLLDKFDKEDGEYGTIMAKFLHSVQKCGIKTSIDVVSNNNADYPNTIIPALKYCDYAIMNEIESTSIWGISPTNPDGKINIENINKTMRRMAECGVKEKIIVHSKKAGFCLNVQTNEFTIVPSLKIPNKEIKGSVGAGDAFCAGCLYQIYNNKSDSEILEFASAAAACNLFSANSIDGMLNKEEILKLPIKYGRHKL